MDTLKGKVVMVTGGGSGIGRAAALLMAQEGAALVVVDIDPPSGAATAEEICAAGGQAAFIAADVAKAEDCQRAVQGAVDLYGRLDVLFNNVGMIRRATVLTTTEEEWDRVMDVNVKSIFLMSRHTVPVMGRLGGGSIINTGSGWGLKGGSQAVSYCASKGAVVNMTRAMAIDHGPQNIRVNCVCPGDTDTPMLRSEAAQLGRPMSEFMAEAADRPLRRFAQPIEIAQAVLWLASDASSYVTGAVLVVDGGGIA